MNFKNLVLRSQYQEFFKKKEHTCRICGKVFSTFMALGGHTTKKHPNSKRNKKITKKSDHNGKFNKKKSSKN